MQGGYTPHIEWRESEEALFKLCKQETETHNQLRLQSLCLLRQGESLEDTARTTGVHPRTIRQWVAWYRKGGVAEVRRHRAGRYRHNKANSKHAPAHVVTENSDAVQSDSETASEHNQSAFPPVETHYQFVADESVSANVKRIITEHIDRAVWQLTEPPKGRDKGVHDARKCFKKIRAVLRLVRAELGEDIFKRENIRYRDAGRRLAPVRESAVLIQTFDRIVDRFANQLAPGAFFGVRAELEAIHQTVTEQILDHENHVPEVLEVLHQARQQVPHLPIINEDFSALYGGLRRVYRRGRNRLADAYAAPSAESFHEWRKRLKYLWYHMRLLNPVWPGQLTALATELSEVADWLGDDHDLAELRLAVMQHPEWFRNEGELQVLLALMEYWRREFQIMAKPVGERIYVDSPKVFVNRIAAYWQVWRTETGVNQEFRS